MTDRQAPVALVTGGAHGIGAVVTARLAREGWRLIVADRNPHAVTPPNGRSIACDVSDEAAVTALIDGIRSKEGRLNALVSNAGFGITKPVTQLTLAEWSSVIG